MLKSSYSIFQTSTMLDAEAHGWTYHPLQGINIAYNHYLL